jgi:short subunit dehydrogenase-like uncharacterized protein
MSYLQVMTKTSAYSAACLLLLRNPDTAYLMTSELLVETGMLLVEKDKACTLTTAGVVTPAVAFGSQLTQRITTEMEVSFGLEDHPINEVASRGEV